VARDWLETWGKGQSERYVNTVRYRLEGDILPALGSKAIDSIETPDIVKAVKSIEKRGAEDLAKRDIQKIKQIYRYAISTGEIKSDPAAGIVPRDILASHEVKNFARIEKEHLPELLKDIELYRGNQMTRLGARCASLSSPSNISATATTSG
jgi:site-specific recombinase XerD